MSIPQIAEYIVRWFIHFMSAEKILIEEQNIANYTTPEAIIKKHSNRVDINDLLARVREEKKREKMHRFSRFAFKVYKGFSKIKGGNFFLSFSFVHNLSQNLLF